MLCAKSSAGGDSCKGDSGGPLVNDDDELIGVVRYDMIWNYLLIQSNGILILVGVKVVPNLSFLEFMQGSPQQLIGSTLTLKIPNFVINISC